MKKYVVILLVVLTIGNTRNDAREVKNICLALGFVKNINNCQSLKWLYLKLKKYVILR